MNKYLLLLLIKEKEELDIETIYKIIETFNQKNYQVITKLLLINKNDVIPDLIMNTNKYTKYVIYLRDFLNGIDSLQLVKYKNIINEKVENIDSDNLTIFCSLLSHFDNFYLSNQAIERLINIAIMSNSKSERYPPSQKANHLLLLSPSLL